MPAHIIRNLVGVRETIDPRRIILAPNFGPSLAAPEKRYGITGFSYGSRHLDIAYTFVDEQQIQVEARCPGGIQAITDAAGHPVRIERTNNGFRFDVANHHRYMVELAD